MAARQGSRRARRLSRDRARPPDARPEVVDAVGQVATVVVELREAADEVQRYASGELVERAAHRRKAVRGAELVETAAQTGAEELRRGGDRALGCALAAGPWRREAEAPRRRVRPGDQRPHQRLVGDD